MTSDKNIVEQHTQLVLDADELATKIRDDLDFLAVALIPEESTSSYPEFYSEVWKLILYNLHTLGPQETFRFALGLPRGHAKTTFIKLLVCYLIIHDYDISFIAVVCATEPLAENFVSDINDILSSDLITQLYGSWQNSLMRDTKKLKTAQFNGRSIILVAIGAGTSVRGLNIQNRRPNLIVLDDVQTKENDESESERRKLMMWLIGTLFKMRTNTGKSALIYIGNLYSNECILAQFAQNPSWISLITGAILSDGSALWPEIKSIRALKDEYNHDNAVGLGSVWFAEVQNDPIGTGSGLIDYGDIIPSSPLTDEFDISYYPIRWMCIDPAGMKKTSDDNVIAGFCLLEDEGIGCFLLDNGKYDPETVIKKAISYSVEYNIPIIFPESNAYQATLAFWMEKYIRELNLEGTIKVEPLPSGTTSKFQRIKSFVKLLVCKKWKLFTTTIYNKVTFQIYMYKITKKNNIDDIIDSQAMGLKALNEKRNLILHAQHHGTVLTTDNLPKLRANNNPIDAIRAKMRNH